MDRAHSQFRVDSDTPATDRGGGVWGECVSVSGAHIPIVLVPDSTRREPWLPDLAARWARVRIERADHPIRLSSDELGETPRPGTKMSNRLIDGLHPTVRACAAAGVDFMHTGLAFRVSLFWLLFWWMDGMAARG